jgi:hypothetical protein
MELAQNMMLISFYAKGGCLAICECFMQQGYSYIYIYIYIYIYDNSLHNIVPIRCFKGERRERENKRLKNEDWRKTIPHLINFP